VGSILFVESLARLLSAAVATTKADRRRLFATPMLRQIPDLDALD
jgi:hypothetical protein